MSGFQPTHELIDSDGESRGLYRRVGSGYINEDTWYDGGPPVSDSEVRAWEWQSRILSAARSEKALDSNID